jgi:large subunit ribosomal protein L21
MYAIIKCGARQYKVRPQSTIEVNRLPLDAGAAFETEQVLLVGAEEGTAQVGTPYVAGARVTGMVLGHFRGRKVLAFKFKRRKNERRKRGHRQELTRVRIATIEVK